MRLGRVSRGYRSTLYCTCLAVVLSVVVGHDAETKLLATRELGRASKGSLGPTSAGNVADDPAKLQLFFIHLIILRDATKLEGMDGVTDKHRSKTWRIAEPGSASHSLTFTSPPWTRAKRHSSKSILAPIFGKTQLTCQLCRSQVYTCGHVLRAPSNITVKP